MTDLSEEMARHEIPGQVSVDIGWIGEGWDGDYDEDDTQDAPLLRFDARDLSGKHRDGDSGYCTRIDGRNVTQTDLEAWVAQVANMFAGIEGSWKKAAESLSWATADDVAAASGGKDHE